jgi:hypothetical protein
VKNQKDTMAPPRKYPHLNQEQRDLHRKVQHSQIERRRRDKINTCLEELRTLVPKSTLQPNLHQLNVLENAVEYIKYLETRLGNYHNSCPPSPAKTEIEDSETDCFRNSIASNPMNITSILC